MTRNLDRCAALMIAFLLVVVVSAVENPVQAQSIVTYDGPGVIAKYSLTGQPLGPPITVPPGNPVTVPPGNPVTVPSGNPGYDGHAIAASDMHLPLVNNLIAP